VQLARCLRDLPHEEAFVAYQRLRRTRVERVVASASRTNRHKASPLVRALRDLVMPVAMKIAVRLIKPEKLAWLHKYRINWDTPVIDGAEASATHDPSEPSRSADARPRNRS
jgi:2-polyprenyl-6-methoxyphenol hydroxylase-like FAD-dependent oxidoreductase